LTKKKGLGLLGVKGKSWSLVSFLVLWEFKAWNALHCFLGGFEACNAFELKFLNSLSTANYI